MEHLVDDAKCELVHSVDATVVAIDEDKIKCFSAEVSSYNSPVHMHASYAYLISTNGSIRGKGVKVSREESSGKDASRTDTRKLGHISVCTRPEKTNVHKEEIGKDA